jgi:DNA helicase-2/ATP-dependent DNA helicase PcrA
MTLHAAKGLEFDHVFLPGWEEGLSPASAPLDEGGQSGLERNAGSPTWASPARSRRATILHAANRRIYGQWNSSIPSRFIGELPPEHIDTRRP